MNVDIRGTVTGDVRAAGQVVTVEAKVDHSASLAGSSVRVGSDATIEKDLQIAGSTSTVEGTVGRDVDAAGSSVAISGMVGGDVQATTDTLQLGSDAKINGNVTYYSHNIVSKTANTHINGKITRKEPPVDHEQRNQSPVLGIVFSFFALLSLAFVSLALFPRKLQALTDLALTQPGMTVLIGLAACIGVPALILVSFMTVIGVMVGIVLLLAWVGIMLLSGIFASYYVGRLILMRTSPQHPFVAMLVGVAILSALLLIPIVNVIALVMTALFGSGMVVRELFAKSPTPRYGHLSHPQRKKQAKA
jgi:cytoskeletal protein CcmA (bactofilin family)